MLTWMDRIYLLDWILEHGFVAMIAGAFVAILAANNLGVPLFMWKGKAIRRFMATTWLARMHRSNATGEVA